MRRGVFRVVCAVLFAAVLVGCGKAKKGVPPPIVEPDDPLARLAATNALMTVDGVSYTKATLEEDSAVHLKFRAWAMEAKGMSETQRAAILRSSRIKCRTMLMQDAVQKQAIVKALGERTKSVAVSEATRKTVTDSAGGRLTFAEIEKAMAEAGLKAAFDRMVFNLQCQADFFAWKCPPVADISDAEVEQLFKRQYERNETASKTNALIYANATNAVKDLRAGLSFEACEKKYLPQESFGMIDEYLDADEDSFPSDDEKIFWREIKNLPVGGVSGVIEASDGLYVFRREADSPREAADADDESIRNFKCIALRRAVMLKILTKDEIRKEMRELTAEKAVDAALFAALKEAPIELKVSEDVLPKGFVIYVKTLRWRMNPPSEDVKGKAGAKEAKGK